MDGYRRNGGHMSPLLLPLATVEWRHVGLDITGFPKIGNIDGAIAVALKLRF